MMLITPVNIIFTGGEDKTSKRRSQPRTSKRFIKYTQKHGNPIFSGWKEDSEPQLNKCKERYGNFISKEPMQETKLTGGKLRNMVRRWSANAAACADSWKRQEWM